MDKESYRNEIFEYVAQKYDEFTEYQDLVLNIYDEFTKLCNKNKIEFFVAYGSLIGVIRDSGCIPWDYDMDLWVPYAYFDKLIDVLEHELGDDYFYVYSNKLKDYPTNCLRICRKGLPFTAIHLDIFFLVGCPNDEKDRKKHIKELDKLCLKKAILFEYKWFTIQENRSLKAKILDIYNKIRRSLINGEKVLKKERRLMAKYPTNEYKIWYRPSYIMVQPQYDADWFKEGLHIFKGGHDFIVPCEYEAVLTEIYGDYMTRPSMSDAFNEFYNATLIIQQRINYQQYDTEIKNILFFGVNNKAKSEGE